MANKQIDKTKDIITKDNSDLKVSFAFVLEDANGKQIQLSDTLTFKCALEPGMIGNIHKRITNTLHQVGQDYFFELLRDYLSRKQEEIYRKEAVQDLNTIEVADEKYIADHLEYSADGSEEQNTTNLDNEEMEIEQ